MFDFEGWFGWIASPKKVMLRVCSKRFLMLYLRESVPIKALKKKCCYSISLFFQIFKHLSKSQSIWLVERKCHSWKKSAKKSILNKKSNHWSYFMFSNVFSFKFVCLDVLGVFSNKHMPLTPREALKGRTKTIGVHWWF